VLHKVAESW
jgi:hypothetical protein